MAARAVCRFVAAHLVWAVLLVVLLLLLLLLLLAWDFMRNIPGSRRPYR